MKIISSLTSFAMVGSLCASAVPAHAQEFEQVSVKVRLADLDLSTSAGAQTAMSRIHKAAEEVCGPDPDLRRFDSRREYDQCVNQAVDRATAALDMPAVTAANAHNERPVRVAASSR